MYMWGKYKGKIDKKKNCVNLNDINNDNITWTKTRKDNWNDRKRKEIKKVGDRIRRTRRDCLWCLTLRNLMSGNKEWQGLRVSESTSWSSKSEPLPREGSNVYRRETNTGVYRLSSLSFFRENTDNNIPVTTVVFSRRVFWTSGGSLEWRIMVVFVLIRK